MKSILLLSTMLSLSPLARALVDAPPPKIEAWRRALESHLDISERETIVNLASLFPKFYGFHFACQFQSGVQGAAPATVLPGEWVHAPEGGKLHCPDHFDLALEKNTKLRLMQTEHAPRFQLLEGQGSIVFHHESFFVETPAYVLAIAGRGAEQTLSITSAPVEQSLFCDRGVIALDVEFKPFAGSESIASRDCRFEITFGGSAVQRYVAAGDYVSPMDVVVPRRFWPTPAPPPGTPGPGLDISYVAPKTASDKSYVQWANRRTLAAPDVTLACQVYGQKREAEAAEVISKFQAKAMTGQFELEPAHREGYISMVCETEKETLASKVMDVGLVAPPPPAFAPAPSNAIPLGAISPPPGVRVVPTSLSAPIAAAAPAAAPAPQAAPPAPAAKAPAAQAVPAPAAKKPGS